MEKITKEVLEDLYLNKRHGTPFISEIFKVSEYHILKLLRFYKIPIRKKSRSKNLKDLTGLKFNKLVVVKLDYERSSSTKVGRERIWECLCECGQLTYATTFELNKNIKKTCGCSHFYKNQKSKLWKGFEFVPKTFFNRLIKSALARDIKVSISIEDIWNLYIKQEKKCALSGVELYFASSHLERGNVSVDRIDSTQEYTINNVQLVHKDINKMKQAYNQEYFIDCCKKIAANFNKNTNI